MFDLINYLLNLMILDPVVAYITPLGTIFHPIGLAYYIMVLTPSIYLEYIIVKKMLGEIMSKRDFILLNVFTSVLLTAFASGFQLIAFNYNVIVALFLVGFPIGEVVVMLIEALVISAYISKYFGDKAFKVALETSLYANLGSMTYSLIYLGGGLLVNLFGLTIIYLFLAISGSTIMILYRIDKTLKTKAILFMREFGRSLVEKP